MGWYEDWKHQETLNRNAVMVFILVTWPYLLLIVGLMCLIIGSVFFSQYSKQNEKAEYYNTVVRAIIEDPGEEWGEWIALWEEPDGTWGDLKVPFEKVSAAWHERGLDVDWDFATETFSKLHPKARSAKFYEPQFFDDLDKKYNTPMVSCTAYIVEIVIGCILIPLAIVVIVRRIFF